MLDALVETVALADGRCDYAEARRVVRAGEHIDTRNGEAEAVAVTESDGIGVRVLAGGAWGFASAREPTPAGAEAALRRALAVAEALPAAPALRLAPVAPARGHWEGPCEQDPFAVPLERKVDLLLRADAAMRGDPRIVHVHGTCLALRTTRAFASTDGAACTQTITECGATIAATAVGGGEAQTRSYPGSHEGGVAAAGWEQVEALDLPGQAPRVAQEAIELLVAPDCPAMTATVVLHGEQLALQLHESIGHALELDRMLGGEASYAGTSWVQPADLGSLRYGSPALNVTADSTVPGGLGTFAWDDEGVAAQSLPLVRDGQLVGAMSSRESAAAIGLDASSGCARADGHTRQPIVRMTNVSVEPGAAGSLADLLADTDSGIYLETNRSWSIDDRRLNFQFGVELAREIRGGELGRVLRNASYAGVTPTFWSSLDAVCGPQEWRLWGVLNCGKGEPGQVAHVSHGTAPARFRDVEVGLA
ncbi:MAG: TldD protein [Solirubrobacteraceae bacterium]|jgi:TldD protein|nr:TldD protein [Solirubrobacteraceae bacterium]